jgi:ERCC4-type nuclease
MPAAKPKPRACVLVDTREQAPLRFSELVDVEVVGLHTGDYSLRGCTDLVAIERKSKPDFVACCGAERERFFDQVQRLLVYPTRALVIEATWEELAAGIYNSQINPRSVTGTVLSLTARGLPVLLAGDAAGAAEAVERLLLRVFKQQLARATAFQRGYAPHPERAPGQRKRSSADEVIS